MFKYRKLNQNALKLIALISMTLDHIGKVLFSFYPDNSAIGITSNILSIIGRFSLPIFIFLIFEGFEHTKDIGKYFLRLGIMGFIIAISEALLCSLEPSISAFLVNEGNIFIDLILTLLILYLINHPNKYIKGLVILPIAYFVISLLIQINVINLVPMAKNIISGLLTQYSLVTPIIVILFIITKFLYKKYMESKVDFKVLDLTQIEMINVSIKEVSYAFSLFLLCLIMYGLSYSNLNLNTDFVINTYFLLAAIPIFFYNGLHKKESLLIQSAYYLYYPLHIVIIYLITYLINII